MLNDENPAPRLSTTENPQRKTFVLSVRQNYLKYGCIKIHSILCRIIFLFYILNIPVICNNPLQMSTPTRNSITLIWTEHAMALHRFFFVSCPLKNQRKGLNSFWDKDRLDRYRYFLCSCVMKSKQNLNPDRQSKV